MLGPLKKATIITGIRRAGKFTLLKHYCQDLGLKLPPLYISFLILLDPVVFLHESSRTNFVLARILSRSFVSPTGLTHDFHVFQIFSPNFLIIN